MSNQTPESVIAEAMVNAGAPLMHSRVEEGVASALRAANMLREPGEPDAATEARLVSMTGKRNRARLNGDRYRLERDAATAAIERVRAIHVRDEYGLCAECSWEYPETSYDALSNDVAWPCPTIAALDGAPEPEETEWVYRARNSILNSGAHVSEEAARATLQLMIENHSFEVEPEPVFVERRPRFAWLPVEGESK